MDRVTLATAGLFAAWAIHDAEEWLTLGDSSRRVAPRVAAHLPAAVPERWRPRGSSDRHVHAAILLMALVMGSAAYDGARTRGRSWWYQNVLHVFGVHGLGHLAGALALRGYASGAATSAPVVIPFWLWARRALRGDGVPDRVSWWSPALFPPVALAAHTAARAISGE